MCGHGGMQCLGGGEQNCESQCQMRPMLISHLPTFKPPAPAASCQITNRPNPIRQSCFSSKAPLSSSLAASWLVTDLCHVVGGQAKGPSPLRNRNAFESLSQSEGLCFFVCPLLEATWATHWITGRNEERLRDRPSLSESRGGARRSGASNSRAWSYSTSPFEGCWRRLRGPFAYGLGEEKCAGCRT